MSRKHLMLVAVLFIAVLSAVLWFLKEPGSDPVDVAPPVGEDDSPVEPAAAETRGPDLSGCRIGIYTGKGSWDVDIEALHNFMEKYALRGVDIDQETINSADLNEICDLLIFAGGWSAEYLHNIKNHANIRSFVEEGGCFVGFCAGAYYAASTVRWNDHATDYPLGFFPGEADGPLGLGWGTLSPVQLNKGLPFNENFMDTLEMWYFDGPRFTGFGEAEVDILARYGSDDDAAIIAFPFGQGRVLLLGPHPELGYIPSREQMQTEGGGGAQWPWLYAALQWLVSKNRFDPGQVNGH